MVGIVLLGLTFGFIAHLILHTSQEHESSRWHPAASVMWATDAELSRDAVFSQPPAGISNKSASLVDAKIHFTDSSMIIRLTTEEEPDSRWTQIFIDSDFNKHTGRRHLAKGEEGADFLMEGTALYSWFGGADQKGWHWRPLNPPIVVDVANEQENTIAISLPLAALKLQKGDRIRLVAEIKTPGWVVTEDTMPREGAWVITIQ